MKKIVLLIVSLLLLAGCNSLMNTPTKKVEIFLNKYQTLDKDVTSQLNTAIITDGTLTDTQQEAYREVMKKQYSNLTYTIKNEKVDGNTATVETEIEVIDYTKAMTTADQYLITNSSEFQDATGQIDNQKFIDYKLKFLKDYTEKVKYTLNFTLTKVDKEWQLDEISEDMRQKIHGIYNYE